MNTIYRRFCEPKTSGEKRRAREWRFRTFFIWMIVHPSLMTCFAKHEVVMKNPYHLIAIGLITLPAVVIPAVIFTE